MSVQCLANVTGVFISVRPVIYHANRKNIYVCPGSILGGPFRSALEMLFERLALRIGHFRFWRR